jgi:branched-chain amino acid transport system ATP-binding protein
MNAKPFLAARGIHAYYGASHVLDDVSIEVGARETLALMGRNGMGKTTLLRTLTGILPPRGGRIEIGGVDAGALGPHRIARLGVATVPEGRGIFPNLSVKEHLVLGARRGADGRRDWTLDRVFDFFPRLAERAGNMGLQLSGGEQQMLSVGRALMSNPSLLLLDEATEGLAPLVRKEIWANIRAIKAAGVAAIVVDKDVRALATVCERAVILSKGRVVHAGPLAELAARPDLLDHYLGVGAAAA